MNRPDRLEPDFFRPDRNRLEEEWCEQPPLYYTYALLLADARAEHEQAKADRDVLKADMEEKEAEIALDIRRNPQLYGLDKVTEGAVASTILIQKSYKHAQQKHFDAIQKIVTTGHRVGVLEAAVKTMDNRKKALEDLCQLCLSNYYSSPRIPGDAGDRMRELERKSKTGFKKRER